MLAQCARQLGLPVQHSVVPEGGNPPELLPDLAKATEGASPKARLLRVVGAGKSAVGYLLTIPEFRDILNRRRAWALKAERPGACKPGKRPTMTGDLRQQPRRARRIAFPKLAAYTKFRRRRACG